MPASSITKYQGDGSLVIKDATGTPLSLTIPRLTDFSFSGVVDGNRVLLKGMSRGEVAFLRKGAITEITGSLTYWLADFTAATASSPLDAARRTGYFASAVSTAAALGDYMCYDMVWTVEGTNLGDSADHVVTFSDVTLSGDVTESMDGNTATMSFICHGGVAFS